MCSSIGNDAAKDTFCDKSGTGKEFDAANANEVCADTPCDKAEVTDVALCCLDPSKAKCLTIGADTTARNNWCDAASSGKVYNSAAANTQCAAASRSASTPGDISACCKSESDGESGGSGGGQAGPGGHLDVKQEALLQDAVLGNVLGKGGSGHS